MAASLHCAKANSSASSFIMLASRASHSAAAQTLDFLAPRATASLGHPGWTADCRNLGRKMVPTMSVDCHRYLGQKMVPTMSADYRNIGQKIIHTTGADYRNLGRKIVPTMSVDYHRYLSQKIIPTMNVNSHRNLGQKIISPRWTVDSRRPAISSRLRPDSTLSTKFSILGQPTYKRHFASSASLRATRCVLNPQHDEEGNELMLEITPRAAKRLSEIMKKDNNPNLALRIQVESGGCHGFQYLMSLTTLPPPSTLDSSSSSQDASSSTQDPSCTVTAQAASSSTQDPSHTVTAQAASSAQDSSSSSPSPTASSTQNPFPAAAAQTASSSPIGQDDSIFQYFSDDSAAPAGLHNPKIILDEPSLDLLKGSKVDFTQELIGSQFKVVDNPLATSSCGCGTSFDIKM